MKKWKGWDDYKTLDINLSGSPQVGKSALALRYLTKNQCDNEKSVSKYNDINKLSFIAVVTYLNITIQIEQRR